MGITESLFADIAYFKKKCERLERVLELRDNSFDEFWDANFKMTYIADGDWNKIIYCGEEFGISNTPDYEIDHFRSIAETTFLHAYTSIALKEIQGSK